MTAFQLFPALTRPDLQSFYNLSQTSRKLAHYLLVAALTCPDLQSSFQGFVSLIAEHTYPAVGGGSVKHIPDVTADRHVDILKGIGDPAAFAFPWLFPTSGCGTPGCFCICYGQITAYGNVDTRYYHSNAVQDALAFYSL